MRSSVHSTKQNCQILLIDIEITKTTCVSCKILVLIARKVAHRVNPLIIERPCIMARTASGSRVATRSKLVRRQVVRRLRLGEPDNWAIKLAPRENETERERERKKKKGRKKGGERGGCRLR